MKQALNWNLFLPAVFAGVFMGCLPIIYFPFLGILSFSMLVFIIICLVDFVRHTNWRKPAGLLVIQMFIAAIAGLLTMGLLTKLIAMRQ